MAYDRPGLLLLWHGDFPGGFLEAERHMALYQKCLFARDMLESQIFYDHPRFDDDYARAGLLIARHLLSRMKPGHLELSYLGLRHPGIRQAIYRAASRGAGRIVCTGAAGLMLPGHGALESLPAEMKKVVRDNPAIQLLIAEPRLTDRDVAEIVKQSLDYSFRGREGRWQVTQRAFRCLEDTGVVLVCDHDIAAIRGRGGAIERLSSISEKLSEMSREACASNDGCAMGRILRPAESQLKKAGFHAVESGFMDFAQPGVSGAARRLLDAGCTHIVAAGVTALLHRHPYSGGGPDASVDQLKKELPDTSIVYVKPDPRPIAPYLADVVMSGVLDADAHGTPLNLALRRR
jgi:sirohydrochlorin ferrochelatase